jgi:hypothetical protein
MGFADAMRTGTGFEQAWRAVCVPVCAEEVESWVDGFFVFVSSEYSAWV